MGVKPYEEAMREARRQYWEKLIEQTGGKRVEMAELSGLTRSAVWRQLDDLGFEPARHGNAAWQELGR